MAIGMKIASHERAEYLLIHFGTMPDSVVWYTKVWKVYISTGTSRAHGKNLGGQGMIFCLGPVGLGWTAEASQSQQGGAISEIFEGGKSPGTGRYWWTF